MKKTLISTIILAIGLLTLTANSAIISVTGPPSSAGVLPAIIPAPENVLDSVAFNSGMEGFNEAQGVVTTVAHNIDGGGSIPAGTLVDSHMIFLNKQDGVSGTLSHSQVVWTFDGPVIGVMSDRGGTREGASTFELGAPGTNYPAPFPSRGIMGGEVGDSYNVIDNQITVTMTVGQPGDWIRVVTLAPIIAEPCIHVEKSVSPEVAMVGDDVVYEICVTNCGITRLEMVNIFDLTLGFIFLPFDLDPLEEVCIPLEYEIQPDDPDPLVNIVEVTGWDEFGIPVEGSAETVVDLIQPIEINVALDVKPTSCPNPLNVNSKGVLPVAICGTEDFDVTQVDPETVQLMLVEPLRWDLEDVVTSYLPLVGKTSQYDCTEEGPDGFMDMTLKFDTQLIVQALESMGEPLTDGEELLLNLTGNLLPEYGGTPIEGEDVVRIIKKK